MAIKLDLPEFQQAFKAHGDLTAPLPAMTAWRYTSGQFPDAVYFLMLGPEMLEALARDARKLSNSERQALKAIVYTNKPRGRNAKTTKTPAPKKGKR